MIIEKKNAIEEGIINNILLCQNNNHSKTFTKYCYNCNKNICENCEQEHENHTLKNLEDEAIKEKRNFILDFINPVLNKEKNELKNIDTENVLKSEVNYSNFHASEVSEFKPETVKLGQANITKKIEFMNQDLFSLINTIIMDSINFNNYSSYKNVENIYNFLEPRYKAHNKKQLQIEYLETKMKLFKYLVMILLTTIKIIAI